MSKRPSSILQSEKECYITGASRDLDCHHIYAGSRRKASDRYGCWVWLQHDVHMELHQSNPALDLQLKQECQEQFEALYGHEKFMQVFGKSYL